MSFSTNFQFNIAQMNSLSQEQEKIKVVSKKQQEQIAAQEEKVQLHSQESINPAVDKDNITKVNDEDEFKEKYPQENKNDIKSPLEDIDDSKEIKEKVFVLKDKNKGKVIDFLG